MTVVVLILISLLARKVSTLEIKLPVIWPTEKQVSSRIVQDCDPGQASYGKPSASPQSKERNSSLWRKGESWEGLL